MNTPETVKPEYVRLALKYSSGNDQQQRLWFELYEREGETVLPFNVRDLAAEFQLRDEAHAKAVKEERERVIEECAQVCNADPAFKFINDNIGKHINSQGTIDAEWQEIIMIPGRIRESIRALKKGAVQ